MSYVDTTTSVHLLPSKTQRIPCSSAKAAYVLFIAGSLIAPLAGRIDDRKMLHRLTGVVCRKDNN